MIKNSQKNFYSSFAVNENVKFSVIWTFQLKLIWAYILNVKQFFLHFLLSFRLVTEKKTFTWHFSNIFKKLFFWVFSCSHVCHSILSIFLQSCLLCLSGLSCHSQYFLLQSCFSWHSEYFHAVPFVMSFWVFSCSHACHAIFSIFLQSCMSCHSEYLLAVIFAMPFWSSFLQSCFSYHFE